MLAAGVVLMKHTRVPDPSVSILINTAHLQSHAGMSRAARGKGRRQREATGRDSLGRVRLGRGCRHFCALWRSGGGRPLAILNRSHWRRCQGSARTRPAGCQRSGCQLCQLVPAGASGCQRMAAPRGAREVGCSPFSVFPRLCWLRILAARDGARRGGSASRRAHRTVMISL